MLFRSLSGKRGKAHSGCQQSGNLYRKGVQEDQAGRLVLRGGELSPSVFRARLRRRGKDAPFKSYVAEALRLRHSCREFSSSP